MPDRAWRSRIIRGAAAMAAVAIAFAVPATGAAQTAAPSGVVARTGELVRVRTSQWEYTGTLARVASDTAVLLFTADSVRIPRHEVLRTEVQRGTRRSSGRVLAFAVGGAAAGFLGGAILGAATAEQVSNDEYAGIGGAIFGMTLGTLAGSVAGGIWGAKKRYPNWVVAVLAP